MTARETLNFNWHVGARNTNTRTMTHGSSRKINKIKDINASCYYMLTIDVANKTKVYLYSMFVKF